MYILLMFVVLKIKVKLSLTIYMEEMAGLVILP